jgi:hypothetical protein
MSGPVFKTSTFGGQGGGAWDDVETLGAQSITGMKRIAVRTGTLVDRIETSYALSNGGNSIQAHGGTGGSPVELELLPNELLVAVKGRSGALVDQVEFMTAVIYGSGDPPYLRTYGPFGGGGGTPFQIWGDIAGFHGRSGSLIDSIGCYLRTETAGPFGGQGGSPFQDPGPIPDLTRLTNITIRSGTLIDSIAATYLLPDGSSQTFSHGGGGGTATQIHFHPGEQIVSVAGRSGALLDNICFFTEDPQGTRRTYGPFGGNGGNPFTVNRKVHGFFGRSGALIDQLGFFVS